MLSMDGGSLSGGNGFVTAGLLQELGSRVHGEPGSPSFLNDVFAFCGTSAGAFNALFLAMHDDPDAALEEIIDFWEGALDASGQWTPGRLLGAITGSNAILSTTRLREFFVQHFGQTRLGDLKHRVVITAFHLDNHKPDNRSWAPKVFHNFDSSEDMDELCAEVALRSGSPPVITPIFQEYIDGGVVANSPAMVALSAALNVVRDDPAVTSVLNDILVLSVGNAKTPAYLNPQLVDGYADWGYRPWLVNLSDPLVLISLFFEAGIDAVNYECDKLLRDGFHRLNPRVSEALNVTKADHILPNIDTLLALPGTQEDLQNTFTWLTTSGWVSASEQPPGSTGTGAARTRSARAPRARTQRRTK
jgi:patatin-like phospholipase/acyl hydrolase